jgi:diaminopimelate decarboxylase
MSNFNKNLLDGLDYTGPVFLYSKSKIIEQINKVKEAFVGQNVRLLYAIKANDYPPVVKLMVKKGLGLHISSKGEYERVKNLSSYTSHTGPFIDQDLLSHKKLSFNLNSIEELTLFSKQSRLGLRINPGCGWSLLDQHNAGNFKSQFGVPYSHVKDMKLPPQIVRLHMHSNSDSLKLDPYLEGFDKLLILAQHNPHIESVNIGGGLGVPIRTTDKEFDVARLAKELDRKIRSFSIKFDRQLELQIECGSYYVREAGIYVYQVKNLVRRNQKYLYYTDGSTIHLQGIGVGRIVEPLIKQVGPTLKSSIIGATCMRGDEIASNILLPKLGVGDLLTIRNAGAYCATQSSHFNRVAVPDEKFLQLSSKLNRLS